MHRALKIAGLLALGHGRGYASRQGRRCPAAVLRGRDENEPQRQAGAGCEAGKGKDVRSQASGRR